MKLRKTFQFFETEEQALAFERTIARHRRGAVTEWSSLDGTEHKWIAWYKEN